MKNIDLSNITDAAVQSFCALQNDRSRHLIQKLVASLHQYAKDVQLTHEEWRAALSFLHACSDISSESRSEFSLLSDVLGVSSLVDLLGGKPGATPGSVLGPFHSAGSPWLNNPAHLIGANEGVPVLFRGRVCDVQGKPLPFASIDYWQNANNGLYWQVDPQQPSDNLRCQLQVDADGMFEIATIRPVPYEIPTDGPVWRDLVQPAQRSSWRAAHAHIIVTAPGYARLVTELFDSEDPYLDADAVFGVREALVGTFKSTQDSALLRRHGMEGDNCLVMDVELRLSQTEYE
jgi:protocatechuate 3,4-dioxygenase beta subunit